MNFDRDSFISLIVTCKDFKQAVDLLLLIKMISLSEEQPLLNVKDDISFLAIEDITALRILNYMAEPKAKYHVALLMEMVPLSSSLHSQRSIMNSFHSSTLY